MFLGESESTRVDYIQSFVQQYHGVGEHNSWEEIKDILDPVFARMPAAERTELRHEFQVLMMQWNYGHEGEESNNPYSTLFYYLDVFG